MNKQDEQNLSDDIPPLTDEMMRQMHLQLNAMEKQLLDEHHNYYYQWMKHLVTLTSGGLTILVAMRSNYIPDSPTALWLLSGCWLLLCLSLLLGLMALYGQAASPLEAADRLKASRKNEGDLKTLAQAMYGGFVIFPHKIYRCAYISATLFFGLALVALLCFAIINKGSPQKSPEASKAANKIETISTGKNNKVF